jgi:protein FAM32A
MASDDYSAAIGGGLKLKGSKPSGVTKKKKKDKSKAKPDPDEPKTSALQRALADEDPGDAQEGAATAGSEARSVGNDDEDYEPGSSKTEAERKYEEMRRKRVRLASQV